jgi:hypothetical protein
VLAQWGRRPADYLTVRRPPFREVVRTRGPVRRALAARWPNGVEATVALRGRFGRAPREPLQTVVFAGRVVRSAVRLPREALAGEWTGGR